MVTGSDKQTGMNTYWALTGTKYWGILLECHGYSGNYMEKKKCVHQL